MLRNSWETEFIINIDNIDQHAAIRKKNLKKKIEESQVIPIDEKDVYLGELRKIIVNDMIESYIIRCTNDFLLTFDHYDNNFIDGNIIKTYYYKNYIPKKIFGLFDYEIDQFVKTIQYKYIDECKKIDEGQYIFTFFEQQNDICRIL